MNFKLEILANVEFWVYKIRQQTAHKITKFHSHFRLKSKREGKNREFLRAITAEILKNSQPTKINRALPLIMDFILNGKDLENWSDGIA